MVTTMIFPTVPDLDCRPYNFFVTIVTVCTVAMFVALPLLGIGAAETTRVHGSATFGNVLLIIAAGLFFGGMSLYFLFIALADRWAKKMERLGKVYIHMA
jgi:hypothetical protein